MIDVFYFGIILIFLNGVLIMILRRRNPIYFLIGIMVSLSSISLLFFLTSRILGNPHGEIYAILIFSVTGIFMAFTLSILIKRS
ncbi:MAG: NADH-quinone oxidoreductase subunit K [candidate division WOR-3 bacterium]